jgi:hypothetical protein
MYTNEVKTKEEVIEKIHQAQKKGPIGARYIGTIWKQTKINVYFDDKLENVIRDEKYINDPDVIRELMKLDSSFILWMKEENLENPAFLSTCIMVNNHVAYNLTIKQLDLLVKSIEKNSQSFEAFYCKNMEGKNPELKENKDLLQEEASAFLKNIKEIRLEKKKELAKMTPKDKNGVKVMSKASKPSAPNSPVYVTKSGAKTYAPTSPDDRRIR